MILEKEYQKRKRAIRNAIANEKIEYPEFEVNPETKVMLEEYALGYIEVKDIVDDIIKRYKK